MVKLVIKTKGMFLKIPGLSPFRTPVEVDITKVNVNHVISELKKNGVEKYKIIYDDNIAFEKTIKKIITKQDSVIKRTEKTEVVNSEILENLKEQHKSILKIEGLLEKFLSFDFNNSIVKKTTERKKIEENEFQKPKKKFDDTIDDFIPSINLDNIKLKGATTTRKITSKTNLENANDLKK